MWSAVHLPDHAGNKSAILPHVVGKNLVGVEDDRYIEVAKKIMPTA